MRYFIHHYLLIALSSFLLLCLLNACNHDNEEDDNGMNVVICSEDDFEEDPEGQWFLGDFHVHSSGASNDTGGDSTPESIKSVALERSLDFVVLTDHSNSTGSDPSTRDEDPNLFNQGPEFTYWNEASALSEAGKFLMIVGNEISPVATDEQVNTKATGHIGCIPMSLANFDTSGAFIDRPKGAVTGGNALQQALDRGCFTIINHPYGPLTWLKYDWSNLNYHAIEVWNGTIGFDPWDEWAYNAWRCDLLSGKQVTAIGASDNHRVFTPIPGSGTDPALGYPVTAVFAEKLSWDAIMTSVQAGKTAIFEGDSRLFIDAYNTNRCRTEGNDVRWIRLRGKVDERLTEAKLFLYHATACTDLRPDHINPPSIQDSILLENPLQPNESFDFSVAIAGEKGVYTAMLRGNEIHYLALSGAIVIE